MTKPPKPNALIIGAMKSATSGLAADLSALPGVYCPKVKEPEALCHDAVFGDTGQVDYLRLFRDAENASVIFEASTAYTKYPRFGDVAVRAKRFLGPDIKLIYMVRNPTDRAISHLSHRAISTNGSDASAVAKFSLDDFKGLDVRNISDYQRQLDRWLDCFPRKQIRVITFDDYTSKRPESVYAALEFLCPGLHSFEAVSRAVDLDTIRNPSVGRIQPGGWLRPLVGSKFYLRRIRQLIPDRLHNRLRAIFGRQSSARWIATDFDVEAEMAPLSDGYEAFLEAIADIRLRPD